MPEMRRGFGISDYLTKTGGYAGLQRLRQQRFGKKAFRAQHCHREKRTGRPFLLRQSGPGLLFTRKLLRPLKIDNNWRNKK
jgi:hypothetical protein